MDQLSNLLSGFAEALSLGNLLYVLLGVVLGTIVGLLPGLGPVAVIALLMPVSFVLGPSTAIIFLAGIYYGAMYGGRIPAILLGVPGDAPAVVSALDGFPLAKQGRGGSALGISAIATFVGGLVAIVGLVFLSEPISALGSRMGSPELFILASVGLVLVVMVGSGSRTKSFLMVLVGLLLGAVGMDPIDGSPRLTGGSLDLMAGVNIVSVAAGLYGLSEVFYGSESHKSLKVSIASVSNAFFSKADWLLSRMAIARASVVGFFTGIIPGGGGALGAATAYAVQRRFSKEPEKFGHGAIDGLAATDTGDNASAIASFIPMFTLGLPPNPAVALLFGALMIQNVTPGPQFIELHPDIFWSVVASMVIGNIVLLVLNLPLIRVFVAILKIRSSVLSPIIIVVAVAGVYSVRNSVFDVGVTVVLGVIGYFLKRLEYDVGPLILAYILGPILETQLRRTILVSDHGIDAVVTRPLSLAMVIVIGVVICIVVARRIRVRLRSRSSVNATRR